MAGHESGLTDALRARHELAPDEHVLAAWDGTLVDLCGGDELIPIMAPSRAILGVTEMRGYLLYDAGLIGFDLIAVRNACSPHQGHVRFSIQAPSGNAVVELAMSYGALAIASQLTAMAKQVPAVLATRHARAVAMVDRTDTGRRVVPKRRSPAA